jgi:hypothetical protein
MTESTCITRLNQVQINSFIASTPVSRVVRGPNHCPRVDVEQLAARSRHPSLIARAPGIAGVSATGHVAGNRAEIPCWDQGQAAEDVRQRNDVDNGIRRGHVQQLGPDLCSAWIPIPALAGTVVEQGFDQGALIERPVRKRPIVRMGP